MFVDIFVNICQEWLYKLPLGLKFEQISVGNGYTTGLVSEHIPWFSLVGDGHERNAGFS